MHPQMPHDQIKCISLPCTHVSRRPQVLVLHVAQRAWSVAHSRLKEQQRAIIRLIADVEQQTKEDEKNAELPSRHRDNSETGRY